MPQSGTLYHYSAVLVFLGAFVKSTDYRPAEWSSPEEEHKLTVSNTGNVAPPFADMEAAILVHLHPSLAETNQWANACCQSGLCLAAASFRDVVWLDQGAKSCIRAMPALGFLIALHLRLSFQPAKVNADAKWELMLSPHAALRMSAISAPNVGSEYYHRYNITIVGACQSTAQLLEVAHMPKWQLLIHTWSNTCKCPSLSWWT